MRADRLRYEHLPGAGRQHLDAVTEAEAREGGEAASSLDRGIGGNRYLQHPLRADAHGDAGMLVVDGDDLSDERERARGLRGESARYECQ